MGGQITQAPGSQAPTSLAAVRNALDPLINNLRVIQRALKSGILDGADPDEVASMLAALDVNEFKKFYLRHRYKKLGLYGLTQIELQTICRLLGRKYVTRFTKPEAIRHVSADRGSADAIIANPPRDLVEISSCGRRDTSSYLEGKRVHERCSSDMGE